MDAKKSSDIILTCVKQSNLNFCLQESPFSICINIKKSYIKDQNGDYLQPSSDFSDSGVLARRNEMLEDEICALKKAFENLESERDDSVEIAQELDMKLQKAKIELSEALVHSNEILKQKEDIKKKHEDKESKLTDAQNETKKLQIEIETMKNERSLALKSLKTKEKEINKLVFKNENLQETINALKIEKKNVVNEKNKIAKEKLKLDKKISKLHPTKSAATKYTNTASISSLNASSNTVCGLPLDHTVNPFSSCLNASTSALKPSDLSSTSKVKYQQQSSISCQTDPHPEIPYNITSPLPPIFNSQLCHHTKPIRFLSRSLFNLDTIDWVEVTPEDIIRDEAEQALCDQYDREIEHFYIEAKDKAVALHEIYEQNLIGKLFEENRTL